MPPGRRALAWFATAALVLLTLGAGYLALGPGRPADRPLGIPAIVASPATPGATATVGAESLLVVPLAAGVLPGGETGTADLAHYTLPPGGQGSWDVETGGCCRGARVLYLVEGGLTVRAAGPVRVVRAAASGSAEPVAAGTELALGAGDAMVAANDAGFGWATAGSTDAQVLEWSFAAGDEPSDLPPPATSLPSNWDDVQFGVTAPAGPATLRIQQVVLAPGEALPGPPGALQFGLGLTRRDRTAIGNNGGTIANVGREEATAYVATVAGSGSGAASPPGATADGTLLAVALPADALPRGKQVSSGLSHLELDPGHAATWSAGAAAAVPGLRVEYVLAGTYTLRAEAPIRVVRADGSEDAPAAGTEVALAPGDAVVSRTDTAYEESNPGAAPAALLSWVLLDGAQRAAPGPGIRMESPLAVYDRTAAPAGPVTLRVRRVELAPDAALPAPAGALQLAATERGAPSVGSDSGGAVVNPGRETATVYVLTLEPAAPGDGAAAGSPAP